MAPATASQRRPAPVVVEGAGVLAPARPRAAAWCPGTRSARCRPARRPPASSRAPPPAARPSDHALDVAEIARGCATATKPACPAAAPRWPWPGRCRSPAPAPRPGAAPRAPAAPASARRPARPRRRRAPARGSLLHLGRQACEIRRAGRRADWPRSASKGAAARQRRGQIACRKFDRQAQALGVRRAPPPARPRPRVHGQHLGRGQLFLEGQRDRARPGADVGDARHRRRRVGGGPGAVRLRRASPSAVLACGRLAPGSAQQLERDLHRGLGVGARDQHPPIDRQLEAPELLAGR